MLWHLLHLRRYMLRHYVLLTWLLLHLLLLLLLLGVHGLLLLGHC